MTDSTLSKPEGLRQWLMSDRPLSRRQAALGRAYGGCRTFARNRLAMVGLVIVLALVLVAICCRRRGRTGWAPTTRAAIFCRG